MGQFSFELSYRCLYKFLSQCYACSYVAKFCESPDFETFIVAAETYVLFCLLNILWGQFYFHDTNSQLYSKIICYDIVWKINNLLMAKGQT